MTASPSKNNLYFLLAILLVSIYVFLTIGNIGFGGDRGYWLRWANHIRDHGLLNIYQSDSNYFPFYLYFLAGFAKLFSSAEAMSQYFYWMHYVTFLFDIAGIYLVWQLVKERYSLGLLLVLGLLNYAFCYNSLIWGQVDAILSFWIFASFYFLSKNKFTLGAVCIALALSFKLQAIVFVPVFGLYLLSKTPVKKWVSKIGLSFLVFVVVIILVCLPFLVDAERFTGFKNAVTSLVGYYPVITKGAANFWSVVYNAHLDEIYDNTLILGVVTFKTVGLVLFFISSFFALYPLLKTLVLKIKNKPYNDYTLDKIMLTAALVGLSFYLFNTQMHERYSHPVFLFLMCYSFLKKDFLPYILFSVAYFLNMESILKWSDFGNYHTAIFQRNVAGGIYLIVEGYLFYRLYRPKQVKTIQQNTII